MEITPTIGIWIWMQLAMIHFRDSTRIRLCHTDSPGHWNFLV